MKHFKAVFLIMCPLGMVNITSGSPNLALGRPTRQSSNHSVFSSDLAVDGDSRTNLTLGTCSHTLSESGPWWAVDLGEVHNISDVVLTNRGDCCDNDLVDFSILLSESDDFANAENNSYKLCAFHAGGLELAETKFIQCNASNDNSAQIVMVKLKGKQPLTLCEVQVFAGNGTEDAESSYKETSTSDYLQLYSLQSSNGIQPSMSPNEEASKVPNYPRLQYRSTLDPLPSVQTTAITTSRTSVISSERAQTSIINDSVQELGGEQCVCRCDEEEDVAQQRIKKYVKEIKTNLTLARNRTSRFLRKHISVQDDRPSALSVGVAGISLCCITLGLLILFDCVGCAQKCTRKK